MIEETNVFELKFKTANNKTRTVTIKNPKANLDAATVEAALSAFIASDAFFERRRLQNLPLSCFRTLC